MSVNWQNILGLIGGGMQMMDPQSQNQGGEDFIKSLKNLLQKKMIGGPQLKQLQTKYGSPHFFGYTEQPSELQVQLLRQSGSPDLMSISTNTPFPMNQLGVNNFGGSMMNSPITPMNMSMMGGYYGQRK